MSADKLQTKGHMVGNSVGGIIILAFGVLYALQLKGLSLGTRDTPGSALLPMLLCLALFLFVCIDLLRGVAVEKFEGDGRAYWRQTLFVGITIGYTLTLESLGYFVSTLLYGLVTVCLFGSSEVKSSTRPFKTILSWVAVVVMITVVVYLLFGVAFGFRLP
jgi:hypothetical protein